MCKVEGTREGRVRKEGAEEPRWKVRKHTAPERKWQQKYKVREEENRQTSQVTDRERNSHWIAAITKF